MLYDWLYSGKCRSNYVRSSTSYESSDSFDNTNCSFEKRWGATLGFRPEEKLGDVDLAGDFSSSLLRSISIRDAMAREVHERDGKTKQKSHDCCFLATFSRFAVLSDTFSEIEIDVPIGSPIYEVT